MKKIIFALGVFFAPLISSADTFMAYNVLCNVCRYDPALIESWDKRKPHVFNVIASASPDVVALQEIFGTMMQEFTNRFSSYQIYRGTLTDNTLTSFSTGLSNIIMFRKSKYTFVRGGSFRLANQPDNTVPPWQDAYKRICTWAVLRTKERDPQNFKALSCHLPAGNADQTKIAVQKLASWLWSQNDRNIPHFVMGDFNSSGRSFPIVYLTSEKGLFSSYNYPNNFQPLINDADNFRIDFVFRANNFNFSETFDLGETPYTGIFRPSDHPAVVMRGNFPTRFAIPAINNLLLEE